jgi:diaminopimelate decarboxylase
MNARHLDPEHHPDVHAPFLAPDGAIALDGNPVEAIAERLGTPLYLYSATHLTSRVETLRAALPPGFGLHYAVKANPHPEVIRHLAPQVEGFDIASGGELDRLESLGLDLTRVSFAGPGKTRQALERAIAAGVKIVVESAHQLQQTEAIAAEQGRPVEVMVRLNDHRQLGNGGLTMAGGRSVFGWDLDDYRANGLAMFASLRHVRFHGIHLFRGSQSLQPRALAEAVRASTELLLNLPMPGVPRLLNLGGGLGIPYAPRDISLDLTPLTLIWNETGTRLRERFPETRLCLELGRFLVGPAGLYLTRVIDRKVSGGHTFLVVDGGLHHFAAATGNFGQVIRRNHPLWPARPRPGEAETVTVVGCLCTPMDVFARDVRLPPVEIGDILVLFQAGAYGFTASPRGFLSHPEPREVFWPAP